MSLSREVARIIAREIALGSKKHWRTLHADALQEIQMSETTNNMNTGSPVNVGPIKQTDHNALEGANKGDHRQEAQGNTNPLAGNDTAPRGETTDQENAGA